MITVRFSIQQVHVFPEKNGFKNVVGMIQWAVAVEEDGAISSGCGETVLDINFSSFKPIEDCSEEQMIEWVVQREGGQPFVDQLIKIHGSQLAYNKTKLGMIPYIPPLSAP
jgi:hypothetical protein